MATPLAGLAVELSTLVRMAGRLRAEISDVDRLRPPARPQAAQAAPGPRYIVAAMAEPRDQAPLAWERESRILRGALAPYGRKYQIDLLHGCSPEDLHRACIRAEPELIHIQAHGSIAGLALEDTNGETHMVPWPALLHMFGLVAGLRCVILNACESAASAQLAQAPYILITSPGRLAEEAAREFTAGFYDALGIGASIRACYDAGVTRMAILGIVDEPPLYKERIQP